MLDTGIFYLTYYVNYVIIEIGYREWNIKRRKMMSLGLIVLCCFYTVILFATLSCSLGNYEERADVDMIYNHLHKQQLWIILLIGAAFAPWLIMYHIGRHMVPYLYRLLRIYKLTELFVKVATFTPYDYRITVDNGSDHFCIVCRDGEVKRNGYCPVCGRGSK